MIRPGPTDLLLITDVQRDFCSGGTLAVPDGDSVVVPINALSNRFAHVVATQDWHPPGHLSFASNHLSRKPFETIEVTYGSQTLWPDHCLQGSIGAEFHPALDVSRVEMILRKGFHPGVDSYSAFVENDRTTQTGLASYLKERRFQRIFIAGLALDYCVRFSAQDALRSGFKAVVVADACRAINAHGMAVVLDELRGEGVAIVTSRDIEAAVES